MWPFKVDRHRRWQQQLSAYIDQRLEPPERSALERHLAACSSCREELESLRTTVALLQRMPQVSVPRSFRLTEAPAPVRVAWTARHALPLRYATAAAAALLLAVALRDLLIPSGEVTGPVVAPYQLKDDPSQVAPAAAPVTSAREAALAPTPAPAAPEIAIQDAQAPAALSAAPGEEALAETREALDVAVLEREEGPRSTLSRALDWLQVGLGALLVALAVLVSLQWWIGRRPRVQG